ncbi:MAG: Hpt domain-containing protein, partial [Proteobacteria bacterium]|nr:Hpt domain-containing protein [Pseudomonadota bacterium]
IKMEGILNNINEGIISIDSSLMIEPEYSSYSSMLFETKNSLAGEPFVDFIFRNSNLAKEQVSVIEETLKASIGESILNWEVNNHLLPFEIRIDLKKNGTIHSKILSMTWTPLLTRDIVERVLVTIREETERRFLEQSLRISTEKNSRLAIIICELAQSNRERAARLVSETRETLLPLAAEHRDFLKTDMVHNLRRNFHTIKGVARSLSMNLLSNAVHSLESAIDMALHGKHEDLEKNLDEIHAITASYQDVFDTIFIPSVTSVSFGEGLWRIVTGVREHLKHHGFQDLIFNFVECSDHEIDI